MGYFLRSNNHDSGEFPVSIEIAMERYVDDHPPLVLRGMHKTEHTLPVPVSQAHMLGKTFRTLSADTDHVAILNFRLNAGNTSLRNVINRSTRNRVLDLAHFGNEFRIIPEVARTSPITAHLIQITTRHVDASERAGEILY